MSNRTAFTIGTLAMVAVLLTAFAANRLRNPYGLEQERLGPKGNEALSLMEAVPNAKNYLLYLYPQHDKNAYVIHLALPDHYIHESNTTKRILKSYSVSASMYYPNLNGKFHPDNANLPTCNGYCGGYVFAFIEPRQTNAHTMNARVLEQIEHDRRTGSPLYKFEDLAPEFGINEHFQVRYSVIEAKRNGNKSTTKEYLIARNGKGEVEHLFECAPYSPSPACSVKFNLASRPELVVDIRFGRPLMAEWPKLIESVESKIASWGPTRIEAVK